MLQLRNSTAIYYVEVDSNCISKKGTDYRWKPERSANIAYSGEVKKGTQKRIRKAVDLLLQCTEERIIYNSVSQRQMKFRLSFITLTLSYNEKFVSGKEAYQNLLKPFLQWLTKTKKINTYIWKAERQSPIDKKGNVKKSLGQLHYHITLPYFIPHDELRNKWNYLQQKNGYLTEFYSQYGHYNPNSTDIHKTYQIKDIESYLVKYISKQSYTHIEENNVYTELPKSPKGNYMTPDKLEYNQRLVNCITINNQLIEIPNSVEGKVWDCSTNLKGFAHFKTEVIQENEINILTLADADELKEIQTEHCSIIKLKNKPITCILSEAQRQQYFEHINKIKSTITIIENEKEQQAPISLEAEEQRAYEAR